MFIVLVTIFTIACQNQNEVNPATTDTAADAAAKSQIITTAHDVLGVTSDALSGVGISTGRSATIAGRPHWGHHDGCKPDIGATPTKVTTTKDSTCYSGTVTIDYGHGNACGGDSTKVHARKGKIMATFKLTAVMINGELVETSTEKITFSGCSRDSIQIDGTIVSTTTGDTTTVSIQNVKLTYADGSSITWSGTLTYAYNNGGTTSDPSDDTKTVSGSLSGTSSTGVAYTNTITKPIVYKFACLQSKISAPGSGTVEVKAGDATSVIDYGDDTCDNTYTVTINGETKSYTF